uniref:Secretion regulating guanine nucleotide exchange factor n=1 Tax=Nothobranchius furzeri TaxID=105023 RepID=A0A8C6Q1Y4_NOTFU
CSMETRREFCLHTWGANSYGQLGQGHVEDMRVPRLSDSSVLQNRAVRTLSGGGGHSVVITESGELFVCGQNNKGQLGLGHNADTSAFQLCPILNQRVRSVSCGWDFSLLLTDCGQLLACGSNAFGQLGVGEKINVAAGLRHSLVVCDSGSVYQWGTGLFSHAKRTLSPRPVPSYLCAKVPCLVPGLSQRTPHSVVAGSTHCVCLTGEGDLFMWGSNKHGQLTTSEPFLPSPTLLKPSLFNGEKVISVWSGWTHVVAQTGTQSGRVFTWGRGDYGQLGRRASINQKTEQHSADSVSEGGHKASEACFPEEVKVLHGATQVRHNKA